MGKVCYYDIKPIDRPMNINCKSLLVATERRLNIRIFRFENSWLSFLAKLITCLDWVLIILGEPTRKSNRKLQKHLLRKKEKKNTCYK